MITSIEELPQKLASSVTQKEKDFIAEIKCKGLLPFAVTSHFASLAGPEKDDPIRRQFFPDPRETENDPFSLDDPLGECYHYAAPSLVHQYRDRALLRAAKSCAGCCRYCFRRVWISQNSQSDVSDDISEAAFLYLAENTGIHEVLVSGGDPLTLDNDRLEKLLLSLRKIRSCLKLRICTRIPVTEPSRLDNETIAIFNKFRPLSLSTHINHERELSQQSRVALAACVNAGIAVKVQTVLLKGINDNAEILCGLFHSCLELGLSPYYLFQLDLAPGTAHFRVPLKSGLAIWQELSKIIAPPSLPVYALDLPGGGGKIHLHKNVIAGERVSAKGAEYVLKDSKGIEWYYPID